MKPNDVHLLNAHTCTMTYTNVIITCNLCQTVFPAVSVRNIEKIKQQVNSHTVT